MEQANLIYYSMGIDKHTYNGTSKIKAQTNNTTSESKSNRSNELSDERRHG